MSDRAREPQGRGCLDWRSAVFDSVGAADPPSSGHRPFSEFVHAARRRAGELRTPHRRRHRERQVDRGLHAARRRGRGAETGRSVQRRHRHAHSQDVQAARRQPPPDRPGTGAAHARRGGGHRSLPARACQHGGRRHQGRRSPRDRRPRAQYQDELPAGRVAVAAPVGRPSDAGDEHLRAGAARRLHRLVALDDQHGRRNRRCSRRWTSARASTTSTGF